MADDLKIKVSSLEYHRNGVSGVGFMVARFTFKVEARKRIEAIATIFDAPEGDLFSGYCAIVAMDDQGKPDIKSRWRGDHFESDLRFFAKSIEGQAMMFPHLRARAA